MAQCHTGVFAAHTVVIAFIFVFGLVIGSFLNVCILRIPEELSIVSPGSRCPQCHKAIKWYDNVPVFGWMWLRGRCRSCGLKISPMYPLVELASGLLFVACYLEFGLTQATVKWLFFTSLLIVLSVTDLRVRMLPDLVNWPGCVAGLFLSAVVPPADGTAKWLMQSFLHRDAPYWLVGFLDGLLGAAFGSLTFWGLGALFTRLMGRQAFGLGDVKMLAMIGAFLGPKGVFLTMLFGSLVGTLIGISVIVGLYVGGWKRAVAERANRRRLGRVKKLRWALAKRYQLPMGTYLGAGALVVVYFAPQMLVRWSQLFT